MKTRIHQKRKCLILFLLNMALLYLGTTIAQAAESVENFLRTNSQYHSFYNIHLPLEANQVNTLFQDRQGLIWFGTQKGVFYYDGYSAHRLTTGNGASSYDTRAFLQPDSTHLYIGTISGLLLFNQDTEQYETLEPALQSIGSITSMSLFNNEIWIGTDQGSIYRYDPTKKVVKELAPEGKDTRRIIHVFEPSNDKLYIGSYNGLSVYDPATETLNAIPFPSSKDQAMITSLLWDVEKNCIWVGTETHFFCYLKASNRMIPYLLPVATPIESLQKDSQGNLLLGTINGLYIHDMKSKQVRHFVHRSRNIHSLCNNLIRSCYIDRSGNTWVGTSNGLSLAQYTHTYQLTHVSELTDNDTGNLFLSLCKDNQSNYWLAGNNGLIVQTAEGEKRWYQTNDPSYPLKHNKIWKVYEDREHDIWLATEGGIAHYNIADKQFVFYNIADQSGQKNARWAYDLQEDHKGRLWIATGLGGLFAVDKAKLLKHNPVMEYVAESNLSLENGFCNNIYQLLTDKDGFLWARTDYGLQKIDPDTETVTSTDRYPGKMVYDGNNSFWYGRDNALCKLDLSTLKEDIVYSLPKKEGGIYSLVIADNLIGFSSSEGITYLDKNTTETLHFNLPPNNYNPGFYDIALNRIIWGGDDVLACFPLHALYGNKKNTPTPAQIMGIYVNDQRLLPRKDYKGISVRRQSQITLPYARRNVRIEIADLSYQTENNSIYYRLNESEGWNKLPATQNQITFANLSPGTHTLSIKNENSPQSDLSAYTHFTIRILPPWYASWIAYTVYILILGALLFLAVHRIRLRLNRKYEETERYLNLSNMKMDFFMHISRELLVPLNLIVTPVTALIEETRKEEQKQRLQLIHKNALRLHTLIKKILDVKQLDYEEKNNLDKSPTDLYTLVQSILDCYESTFKEKKIQTVLSSQPSRIRIEADALKIELALLGLLADISRKADGRGGTLELSLTRQNNKAILQFSDSGSGLLKPKPATLLARWFVRKTNDPEHHRLASLYTVKRCIELHGGNLKMQYASNKDRTNSLYITLPAEETMGGIIPSKETISTPADKEESPTLLIVCDTPEELTFWTEVFADSYICLTASCGKEGLETARQQLPDIIIADLFETENMNGRDFCRNLKNYQPTASIPLVMLASEFGQATEKESIRAGADAFMHKPVDIEGLRLRLAQLLQARRSLEKKIRVEHIARPAEEAPTQNGDEIFLQRITGLIEEQLENTEFNVAMLADLSKADKKQLYRRLKQLTGFTPVEYIRHIRMKKAAMLLTRKDLSVSEVMYKVGFSNASYFSRCFVTEFGMTPTQYIAESH